LQHQFLGKISARRHPNEPNRGVQSDPVVAIQGTKATDTSSVKSATQILRLACPHAGAAGSQHLLHFWRSKQRQVFGYLIDDYLRAKQDRSDMDEDELMALRLLANRCPGLTATLAGQLLAGGDIMKVSHGDEPNIQKRCLCADSCLCGYLAKRRRNRCGDRVPV